MSRSVTLVYDGRCNLCSAHARFVLRRDRNRRIRLVSLYSDEGRTLYWRYGLNRDDPETLIVIKDEALIRDSAAMLQIWRTLGWPWSMSGAVRLMPAAVARNRYRLFCRREACWLPETGET